MSIPSPEAAVATIEPGEGAHAYPVYVSPGLLERLPALVEHAQRAHRYVILTDDIVAGLHGRELRDGMERAGLSAELIAFAAGEASKTRAVWASLTDAMLERGFGRDTCLLALGGGVVGDLGGFVAATYMRGIPVIQIPTTMVAMLDAAIGGKTGVDAAAGKNLVGAFHHPRAVLADPRVLRTLPDDQFRAGLAEALKHGAIADSAYLGWLTDACATILARDEGALHQVVRRSVEIKAAVVNADPRENGARATLNFGHTVAHALERLSEWRIAHGHAVAIGMVVEARLGEILGLTESGSSGVIARACEAFGLPTALPAGIPGEAITGAVASDKKARAGEVRYALIRRPGTALRIDGGWTVPADPASVARALGF